jgi:hypothetical protein
MGDYNRFATEMRKTTQQQQDLAQPNTNKIPSFMEMFGQPFQGFSPSAIPPATQAPQQQRSQGSMFDLSQIPGAGFVKKLFGG